MRKVLLIGEVGHNWVPDFHSALELIKIVRNEGWDIAKFQAYDTDKIKQPGDTNYDELKRAQLTYQQLEQLRDKCAEVGVEFLASAFDLERFRWLEKLGVRRHKVASRSIHDDDLVKSMVDTGKQVIVSTANWQYALPNWNVDFLYCRTRRQILRDGFAGLPIFGSGSYAGFSDHTVGNYWVKKAIEQGATIIEKHITFDKNGPGWDQPSSADPNDMRDIAKFCGR